MLSSANFRVDPRLAAILGEGYRSSEHAIKELVDNAWDADATEVRIQLAELLSGQPITVRDNGSGMTEKELRGDYLSVATDRRTRKGDYSTDHKRRVKGRKGIGKFAGIMLADRMTVETTARGVTTSLVISKDDLLLASQNQEDSDLEKIALPVETSKVPDSDHGTKITLSNFNQKLSLPTPERLRELLVLEYGSNPNFRIFVNDAKLDIEDISGKFFEQCIELPEAGKVRLRIKISDGQKPLKQSGIIFRVQDKIVGQNNWYGLDNDDEIPAKLLKKVRVEIEADGLVDATTADWGAFVENNRVFETVKAWAQEQVKVGLRDAYQNEMQLAHARLQRQIKDRLAVLPEYRRETVQRALEKILSKFYDEKVERQDAVISIVLDAFERDEYWTIVEKISAAKHRDVEAFAEALAEFGLLQLSLIAQQATYRLKLLDAIDELIDRPNTLEKDVHTALENNLWVFGSQYALMASNKSLRKTIATYTDKKFVGERANKRPDLLLAANVHGHYVLFEFKRPQHSLTRSDELQAVEYRDDLTHYFPNSKISINVVGGGRANDVSPMYSSNELEMLSYREITSAARTQLDWLMKNLIGA